MQIQRFQTLFLIIAVALTIAYIFMPYGYSYIIDDGQDVITEPWYPANLLGLVIPSGIASALLLIDIFLFNNMTLQKAVAWIGLLCILATIGVTVYVLASGFHDITVGDTITHTKWAGGGLMLVAAALSVILAISRISADQRLLRSIDHIR